MGSPSKHQPESCYRRSYFCGWTKVNVEYPLVRPEGVQMKRKLWLIGVFCALLSGQNLTHATWANPDGEFNIRDAADLGCNKECSSGMVRWSVSEPYINLWLSDAPVSYTTSLGETIQFQVH